MPQFGDINAKELNSVGTYSKKVLLYGWDSSALEPVKIAVDANGNLKIDPTLLDTRYLLLDQTTPQTVSGGIPIFSSGISIDKIYGIDPMMGAELNLYTTGYGGSLYYHDLNDGHGYVRKGGYAGYYDKFMYEVPIWMHTNNLKMLFGAAQNASIYYDGTDLVINSKEAGTGKVNLGSCNLLTTGTLGAGAITCTGFKLTTSPVDGYALISDSNGNGTWQFIGAEYLYADSATAEHGSIEVNTISFVHDFDNIPMICDEGSGADPLDIIYDFINITDFSQLAVREQYIGTTSHHIQFQLYNWGTATWDSVFEVTDQAEYVISTIFVYNAPAYIGTGGDLGKVRVRFHHIQNGNSSHRLNIDFIWLVRGDFIGASTDLSGYAKYLFGANNFSGTGNFLTTGTLGAGAITGTSYTIGANELTTSEFSYLDGINQALKTSDTVQFLKVGVNKAPTYRFDILPTATDATCFALDGASNPYTGSGTSTAFSLYRTLDATCTSGQAYNVYGGLIDYSASPAGSGRFSQYNNLTWYGSLGATGQHDYTSLINYTNIQSASDATAVDQTLNNIAIDNQMYINSFLCDKAAGTLTWNLYGNKFTCDEYDQYGGYSQGTLNMNFYGNDYVNSQGNSVNPSTITVIEYANRAIMSGVWGADLPCKHYAYYADVANGSENWAFYAAAGNSYLNGTLQVVTASGYAEMYMYDNATACQIDVANVYHAVYNTFGNNDATLPPQQDANYFTYKAGVGYAIASVATYSAGTKIQCTVTAGHALLAGEPITITGSANYDGTYLVQAAGLTATQFVVNKAYVATNTGSARRPATLKCLIAGVYEAAFNVSGVPANPNDNFKWELNKDITPLDNIATRAIWSSTTKYESTGSHGLCSLTAGQYVWLAVKNYTGTGDLTMSIANVNLHILK